MEELLIEVIKNPVYVLGFLLLFVIVRLEKIIYQNNILIKELKEYIKTKDGFIEKELQEIKEVILWIKEKFLTS